MLNFVIEKNLDFYFRIMFFFVYLRVKGWLLYFRVNGWLVVKGMK